MLVVPVDGDDHISCAVVADDVRRGRREAEVLLAYARYRGELRPSDHRARLGRLRQACLLEDVWSVVADLPRPPFLATEADARAPVTESDRYYVRTLLSVDTAGPGEYDRWLGQVFDNAATVGELRWVVDNFADLRVSGEPARSDHVVATLRNRVWEYACDIWAAGRLSNVELHGLGERISVAGGSAELEALAVQLSARRPAPAAGAVPPTDDKVLEWGRMRRDLRTRMTPPRLRISDYGELIKARRALRTETLDAGAYLDPPSGVVDAGAHPGLPRGDLRISHAERQDAAAALTAAFDDGRLNAAEYGVRLRAVQAARTYRDLLPLVAGLDALASDAERAQVMAAIEAAGVAGLLDPAERLDLLIAARTATTDAELARLTVVFGPPEAGTGVPRQRPDRSGRASDADREQVVCRLRIAAGEGRLTLEEFDDRAASAYAARHLADLDPLVADLPESAGLPVADQDT